MGAHDDTKMEGSQVGVRTVLHHTVLCHGPRGGGYEEEDKQH